MSLRAWFGRHQLSALFLIVSVIPALLLAAIGWKLVVDDREAMLQQIRDRREEAADLVVAALEQRLVATEQTLGSPETAAVLADTEDAVVVTLKDTGILVSPAGRLPFRPLAEPGVQAPDEVYAAGEELERRSGNSRAAAASYRTLAGSSDSAVRAGALLRLARTLRKGDPDAALAAYSRLQLEGGVSLMGVPADLLARWARCGLLAELKRDAELRGAAAELARHLIDGRWAIDRTTFDLHLGDAAGWLHPDGVPSIPASRLALANVVERLWNSRGHRASSGRETAVIDATRITALWRRGPEGVVALVAGPSYAERHWLDGLVPQMERHQIRVSLYDPGDRQRGTNESRRSALDTGLPWQVVVEDTDLEEQLAALGTRRRWWLTGLAVFGVFIFAGTWMIGSAVARELAVARLQSDFVAAVSHEFRTPLTSMRQLTEILVDERIASDDRRRSYYQALARQTDRLQRLVESLLDFGRMEAGRSPYRLEPLDLAALVRSVVDQFEAEVSGRGYHVELAIDGPTSTIAGDREALTHALWNLLDNAVKYSAETRTVWVRVEPAGDRLAVRVRDRGIGIPTGEQRAIFQKFVRGAAARAENIAGTGIGLAMVHHVVSAHGGEVQVESEPGSGSTFTILLPTLAPSAVRATTLQAVRD